MAQQAQLPLLAWTPRSWWLRACCAVAEGAAVAAAVAFNAGAPSCAAALHDARVHAQGGRAGLRRSAASVYSCFVTHFLGARLDPSDFNTVHSVSVKALEFLHPQCVAVSHDGAAIFAAMRSGRWLGFTSFDVYATRSGALVHRITVLNGARICHPRGVFAAADGAVFLVEVTRLHILDADLSWRATVAFRDHFDVLYTPKAACADARHIAVLCVDKNSARPCNAARHCGSRVSGGNVLRVLRRETRAAVSQFWTGAYCFHQLVSLLPFDRVAVSASTCGPHVHVLSLDGVLQRVVSVGFRVYTMSTSAFGELLLLGERTRGADCHVILGADGVLTDDVAVVDGVHAPLTLLADNRRAWARVSGSDVALLTFEKFQNE
jgi:hypothetical protein